MDLQDADEWCLEEAWFEHSTTYDFRVIDPLGSYILGTACASSDMPKEALFSGPKAEVR